MPKRARESRTAVAYLRASTSEQRLSPEVQRSSIEVWAVREGVTIAAWFTDEGVSGATPIASRPGLLAAIAALRSHHAGFLVAAKRCRLARDVGLAATIGKLVEREGATVRTVDGMSDAAGSAGMIQRGVADLFNAYEREVIRERTKSALAVKRAKGERTGGVPYGWCVGPDGVRLAPVASEQETIATIRRLRVAGLSLRGVIEELECLEIKARSGRAFILNQVARIVARSAA